MDQVCDHRKQGCDNVFSENVMTVLKGVITIIMQCDNAIIPDAWSCKRRKHDQEKCGTMIMNLRKHDHDKGTGYPQSC